MTSGTKNALQKAAQLAQAYLSDVAERPVAVPVDLAALRGSLGGPLPEAGEEPAAVVEALARAADPGLVATAGPSYFGFVVGGGTSGCYGRRLASHGMGSNGGTLCGRARRSGGGGNRGRLAA